MLVVLLSWPNGDRTISLVALLSAVTLFGAVTLFWVLFCGGLLLIEALLLVSIILIRRWTTQRPAETIAKDESNFELDVQESDRMRSVGDAV